MRVSVRTILELVVQQSGVSMSEIQGDRKFRYIVDARWAAMIVMRERLKMSLPHIAMVMGHKHHTTAIHAVKAKRSPELLELIDSINNAIDEMARKGTANG